VCHMTRDHASRIKSRDTNLPSGLRSVEADKICHDSSIAENDGAEEPLRCFQINRPGLPCLLTPKVSRKASPPTSARHTVISQGEMVILG
jgi:hypothetical protein